MKRVIGKVLCCCLVFLLVCSAAPPTSAAAAASGACGDGVTWTLQDGVLTICGSGKITSASGWKSIRGSITSIVIEEGVTSIGTAAFDGCASAASVSLPSTLTSIGVSAFCNCSALTEIALPEGLQTIGSNAFTNCTSLTSLTLPSTLTALADSVFSHCSALSSVTLSEGLVELSQSAFMGCGALTSITIPSSVNVLGAGVFYNCTKLVSVYFMGDAPEEINPAASNTLPNNNPSFADRVTLYYKADANGWTSPTWNGFKTALWNDSDSPFLDVSDSAYYYDAALWALENEITLGTQQESAPGAGDALFSPERTCTRGEVVTFLWRAHGEPAPASTRNPFSDVAEGDYCYEAVLWAVEQGITTGTQEESSSGAGDGLFAPGRTCTYGEILTFQWRANGKPEATGVSTLAASCADTDFYKASVAWADTNGLLINNSVFVPTDDCPRADVVTYLYLDAV